MLWNIVGMDKSKKTFHTLYLSYVAVKPQAKTIKFPEFNEALKASFLNLDERVSKSNGFVIHVLHTFI